MFALEGRTVGGVVATLVRATPPARWVAVAASIALGACSRSPPPSRFPSAADAIARMRATSACSRGVQGESKVDYFGEQGRVRGSTLFVASRPDRVRFDIFSPFGVTLSTLTSDGSDFALLDVPGKAFFAGPASECNVARFLRVPVPPHALVTLLSGEAPVLVHERANSTLGWEGGSYVIRIQSRHGASEVVRLEPRPGDWNLDWTQQRMRVSEVTVVQQGIELYRIELSGFAPARTARPRVDPDGIDPDLGPSGPACEVDVPRRIRITSEASAQDVLLVHQDVSLNPPLVPGLFHQSAPAGVRFQPAFCR